jgi:hypothetical protein
MLQLVLATVWLLDAVLQYQPFMFSRAFGGQMLTGAAAGNPVAVAHSITWAGGEIGSHAMVANSVFATVQLLIAFGIAWRPTVKFALAASIPWSFGVWWIGEGFGGTLTGTASVLNGAPGAVILYALLALLLWPTERRRSEPVRFVAAGAIGERAAKVLWLVLWGGLGYAQLLASNRSPRAVQDLTRVMAAGEPQWLASLDHRVGTLLAGKGLEVSIALVIFLAVVAVAVLMPAKASRAVLVLAIVVAFAIWVIGENFGGIFSGSGTDPNSGPLLALLVAAYWPQAGARLPGEWSPPEPSGSAVPARQGA